MNQTLNTALILLLMLPQAVAAAESEDTAVAVAAGRDVAEGWSLRAFTGLSLTQVHLTGAAEGQDEDSLQWAASFDGEAKQLGAHKDWRSKLLMEYGKTESDLLGSFESLDRIAFDSIYTRRTEHLVDPYSSFSFRAVFTDFRRDPRSYTGTIGLGRFLIYEKDNSLVLRAGASFRSVDGIFTAGLENMVAYENTFSNRAYLRSELKAFNEYDFAGADVTAETLLIFKFSKIASLKLSFLAEYDFLSEDELLDPFGVPRQVPVWPNDIRLQETLAVVIGYALL